MKTPNWWSMLAVLSVLETGVRAQPSPAVDPEFVELPKVSVLGRQQLPVPESWRYAKLPQFEVLSNAGDRETASMLRELQNFNSALEVVWPALHGRNSTPITLVLCEHEREFSNFLPAKSNDIAPFQGMGSIFLHAGGRAAIVLRTADTLVNIQTPSVSGNVTHGLGFLTNGVQVEPNKQLDHEYAHFLLSAVNPRMPAWFEEGLAQILIGMKLTAEHIELAKLEDPNLITAEEFEAIVAEAPEFATTHQISIRKLKEIMTDTVVPITGVDRDFQVTLIAGTLMSFPVLFAVSHDSALARNTVGGMWAKQAHAFVHLCLYGEGKRYQKGLLKFVTRLAAEPVSEGLFKDCFGLSYHEMDSVLRVYIDNASYTSLEWNVKKGGSGLPEPAPVTLREATQAEVGRLKGETALLAGNIDNAEAEFTMAYRRGEHDPNLLASLGIFEAQHGKAADAAKFLQAAVAAKTDSAAAYVTLARLRLDAALAATGSSGGLLSAAQVENIAAPLRLAMKQTAPDATVPELLAETWQHGADKIFREDAVLLMRGALTFPSDLKLAYQTAVLCGEAGFAKEAAIFVEHGIKYSANSGDKSRFEQLKASLAQASN
ncbi:MAG: hypothetical protein JWQ62_697 [Lacunisphaera sp.]|nr:hypothetical protein [Lacunisphaera sp.]